MTGYMVNLSSFSALLYDLMKILLLISGYVNQKNIYILN